MTSIEKLYFIINVLSDLCDRIENKKFDLTEEQVDSIVDYLKDIKKDLRRLEKLESEIQTKIDTLQKRQEYLNNCLGNVECFMEYNFNIKKLELLFELKKVLENDK